MNKKIGRTLIKLNNHKIFPWKNKKNIFIRGYAFIHGKTHNAESLIELFLKKKNKSELISLIKELDGPFSIIININEEIFVFVNILRSFPLFYKINKEDIIVTDFFNVDQLKNENINTENLEMFKNGLSTLGETTLLHNWFQLQSGEYLEIKKESYSINKYWDLQYAEIQEKSLNMSLKILRNSYEETFENVVKFLDGRTAVIPLSGGHDSRLVAYYLYKLKYPKVITYSYGTKNIDENKYSEEVSKALGFKHYYVEYDNNKNRKIYKKMSKDYLLFSGNVGVVPCIQELIALKELTDKEVINKNCVVIPGFACDALYDGTINNFVEKSDSLGKFNISNFIIQKYYKIRNVELSNNLKVLLEKKTKSLMKNPQEENLKNYLEIIEKFDLLERQSKFIQNAVRVYEFFDLEWITPYFSLSQLEIIEKIDYSHRVNRNLMYKFEEKEYPDFLKKIDFAKTRKEKLINSKLDYITHSARLLLNRSYAHFLFSNFSQLRFLSKYYDKRYRNVNVFVQEDYIKYLSDIVKGE